ncbi:hypothetical protein [Streptacidiphilus jiangxiensis]|uniref:Uncharacterized protein n=1 Tax=Streptacidiphilus jiangxiensis TaxID=235985 RepID=A0A1H7N1Z0_STRJI|nr:hypothetical protein [Streptacidiphilus jiangxiensis]SEL16897.1 hypothetical protein SAMN05414137_106154 [Streptacidiphilus jiangxiensis]
MRKAPLSALPPTMAEAAVARRGRRHAVLAAVLGVVFAVGSVACWVGFAANDAAIDAFLAARPCAPTTRVAADADCLVSATGEVGSTYVTQDKYQNAHLVLRDVVAPFPVPGVSAAGGLDVWLASRAMVDVVKPGDRTTLALWKGAVVGVSADGASDGTIDTPKRDATSITLILALYSTVYALVAFAYLAPATRREAGATTADRRRARLKRLWPFSWILATLGLAGYGSMAVFATPLPLVLTCTFAALVGVSVVAVVVVRPGLPARPLRQPPVHLPSATTPFE